MHMLARTFLSLLALSWHRTVKAQAPPSQLNAVVMLVDYRACGGAGPAVNPQELEGFFFGRELNTLRPTLEAQFRFCSHGKLSFGQKKIITVPMQDCTGFQKPSASGKLDAGCPDATQLSSFVATVEAEALKQGFQLAPFTDRWAILDKSQQAGTNCNYMGLASTGADVQPQSDNVPARRLLFTSERFNLFNMQGWLHEVGHTLGLQHSSANVGPHVTQGELNEYGDNSCGMGGPNSDRMPRCFSLAHSTMLGWVQPLHRLDSSAVPTGKWKLFPLPRPSSTDHSGMLMTHGSGKSRKNWFLSFRKRSTQFVDLETRTLSPYSNNAGIEPEFAQRVLVHLVEGEYETEKTKPKTTLKAILGYQESFVEPESKVVMRSYGFDKEGIPGVLLCKQAKPGDCK